MVLTLDVPRRDSLAQRIQAMVESQELAGFAGRFWIVAREELLSGDWASPMWRNLPSTNPVPFLTAEQREISMSTGR